MTNKNPEKLLYIFDHTDWHSRMPMANEAKKQGWDITIGMMGEPEDTSMLEGFKTIFIDRPQGRLTPISAIKTILALRKAVDQVNADVLHTVTLKYSFLIGLATAFRKGYRVVYTLAGLGFLFRGEGLKPNLVRIALSPLLKFVFLDRKAQIIFQNPDDQEIMIDKKYVRAEQTHLVKSSGVNLDVFKDTPLPEDEEPLILMPTRLVHEKGVHIFVEAARLLKSRGINARFEIAGGVTKHNPRAITQEEMEEMVKDKAATWLGRVDNMPQLLQKSTLIVYPSYYGEGVPRVLLEACAAARPIITTDHPGCKEAVNNNFNGLLVPIKDAESTANAIETMLKDKENLKNMAKNSRTHAKNEFDLKKVNKNTIKTYK